MDTGGSPALNGRAMVAVGCCWMVATIAAVALWQKAPAFIDASYGSAHQPFELLGMFLSAVTVGTAVVWLWARPERDATTVAVLGASLLPVFAAIHQVSEHAKPSWDWKCYVGGAEAVLAGSTPYADCYLYPPLVAEAMAAAYPWFAMLGEFLALNSPKHWMLMFFVWHSFQVLMVALLVYLLQRLVHREGGSPLMAAIIVAVVLVVCTPLERTIRHNQVNLLVLNLVLLGIDRVRAAPTLAGGLLAVAAHIKLLPLAVMAPMAIGRRWRFVASAGVATAVVAVYPLLSGSSGSLWAEFFAYGPQFVSGEYFRDNSFTGLLFNTVRVPIDAMGGTIQGMQKPLRLAGAAVSIGVVTAVLFAARHCRNFDELGAIGLASMMLLSPVAWEHHYVWALPLVVLVAARRWERHPLTIAAIVVLIGALPTFDVYPLSYHRLAGLLWLLRFELSQGSQR